VFWDVHGRAEAIGIALRSEQYSKLVIEADDPGEQIRRIRAAIGQAAG
jgi:hypothetical protein